MNDYVHGYTPREHQRLTDQAGTLTDLFHHDTYYPAGSTVLEAGCGVGGQTVPLLQHSPDALFTCVDISEVSLRAAQARADEAGVGHATFQQADIHHLPLEEASFDHVFVCFVLEHLPHPVTAVQKLLQVLKPGGTLTVIEGDHGSTYFDPPCPEADQVIQCLVDLQAQLGGDALIGRRLYPLLRAAGLEQVSVSPRMIYVDDSRPEWVDGFTENTFTAMVEGVRDQALAAGIIDEAAWDRGIAGLRRTQEPDGVFCYAFFKAVAQYDG